MRLNDVYVIKDEQNINMNRYKYIRIDSFISHITKFVLDADSSFIVYNNIMSDGSGMGKGFSSSFNGYGKQNEIEEYYELYIDGDDREKLIEFWEMEEN